MDGGRNRGPSVHRRAIGERRRMASDGCDVPECEWCDHVRGLGRAAWRALRLPSCVGLATGWLGRRAAIAWNLLGLALLFNAIGTVATSAPGPLHLDWPGEPFAAIALWPIVWIPALFAPAGIFLHVLTIRQAFARIGAGGRGVEIHEDMGIDSRGLATERRVEG